VLPEKRGRKNKNLTSISHSQRRGWFRVTYTPLHVQVACLVVVSIELLLQGFCILPKAPLRPPTPFKISTTQLHLPLRQTHHFKVLVRAQWCRLSTHGIGIGGGLTVGREMGGDGAPAFDFCSQYRGEMWLKYAVFQIVPAKMLRTRWSTLQMCST